MRKTIAEKLIPIILLFSILASSCSVKPPEAINWTNPGEASQYGTVNNTSTIPAPVPGITPAPYLPGNTITAGTPTVDCDEDSTRAETCTGDTDYGFTTFNGKIYCYVEGQCYTLSETASQEQADAITNTYLEYSKVMGIGGTSADTIEAGIAALGIFIAAGSISTTAGCTIGAALTLGGACLVAVLGTGVAGLAFLYKFGSVIGDIVKVYNDRNYLKEQVANGVLIPCGGQ